jgi:hypothetical protein
MGVLVDVSLAALLAQVGVVVARLLGLQAGDPVAPTNVAAFDVGLFARRGAPFGRDGGSLRGHGVLLVWDEVNPRGAG